MKRKLIALCLSFMVISTGCGVGSISLSDEENNMVAEYMAGVLLKYDFHYDEKLLYPTGEAGMEEPIQEEMVEQQASPSIPDTQVGDGEDTTMAVTETYQTIADIFADDSCSVSFRGAGSYQSYPEESDNRYFLLEANQGKQLLVLSFDITNPSNQTIHYSLKNANISYQLEDAQGKRYKALLTALPDDMKYFDAGIETGKTERAVILFEIPEDTSISSYVLYVERDGARAQLSLSE